MSRATIRRWFLLSDGSTSGRGFGQCVFALGKAIGTVGRVVATGILVASIVACLIEPQALLVVGYGLGALFAILFLTEVTARLLMLCGNWWVVRIGKRP
jgi:hypothetical protein